MWYWRYSSLTNKWITFEKNEDIKSFMLEHVCFGDTADNVPKIQTNSEMSQDFHEHCGLNEVEFWHLSWAKQQEYLESFNEIHNKGIKGNSKEFKKPFNDKRLGLKSLLKEIEKAGSLENFIDSNPIYRLNFDRNTKLVLLSKMPLDIFNKIISEYTNFEMNYQYEILKDYLLENYSLKTVVGQLASSFNAKPKNIDNTCNFEKLVLF